MNAFVTALRVAGRDGPCRRWDTSGASGRHHVSVMQKAIDSGEYCCDIA